jgi:hypothetical protein
MATWRGRSAPVQRKHFDPPELNHHSVPHRRLMAKAR